MMTKSVNSNLLLLLAAVAAACDQSRPPVASHLRGDDGVGTDEVADPLPDLDVVAAVIFEDGVVTHRAGNVAGRLRLASDGAGDYATTDILITETLPERVPDVRAILLTGELTAVPASLTIPLASVKHLLADVNFTAILERAPFAGVLLMESAVAVAPFNEGTFAFGERLRVAEKPTDLGLSPEELASATEIVMRVCDNDTFRLHTVELTSEGEIPWFAENLFVELEFHGNLDMFQIEAGRKMRLERDDFSYIGHPFMHHGPWDLSFKLKPEAVERAGFSDFSIYVWGSWDIFLSESDFHAASPDDFRKDCDADVLWGYDAWLVREVLSREPRGPSVDANVEPDPHS